MKTRRILAGAAGALALTFLVWRTASFSAAIQTRKFGVVILLVLAVSGARILVQTKAWQIALRAEEINVPQWRLVAIRLASQATGYLASMGPVVAEPAKLALLRHPSGMTAAAPATLFETGMYWFTGVVLGLAGTVAAALVISDSAPAWAAAAVFGAALIVLTARRAFLSALVSRAGSKAPRWLSTASRIEQQIRSWREIHRDAAATLFAIECLAQLFTLAEVAIVLWALGIGFSFPHVLAIEACGRITKIAGAWIPGRIGAEEGGGMASFALLGLAPQAGLTLVLARRVRDVLWCSAGIVWMVGSTASPKHETQPGSSHFELENAA